MRKNLIIGVAAAAAISGGAAGAIAATSKNQESEQAVLADAAKRLGVDTDELRSALSQAEDAQLDAAVKAGQLTQAQADDIRAHRRQEGSVLGLGPGGPGHGDAGEPRHGGPGAPGFGGPAGFGHPGGGPPLFADAAKALGISVRELFTQLRSGKSPAEIAKAQGKTLAEVEAAVKQAATKRLDASLKADDITQAQHDEALEHLDDLLEHLGDAPSGGRHRPEGFGHFGPRP